MDITDIQASHPLYSTVFKKSNNLQRYLSLYRTKEGKFISLLLNAVKQNQPNVLITIKRESPKRKRKTEIEEAYLLCLATGNCTELLRAVVTSNVDHARRHEFVGKRERAAQDIKGKKLTKLCAAFEMIDRWLTIPDTVRVSLYNTNLVLNGEETSEDKEADSMVHVMYGLSELPQEVRTRGIVVTPVFEYVFNTPRIFM